MSWTAIADVAAAACLVIGALLTLIAAIGILRFPDLLTRMHSATKPQVLGLLVVLVGLGLRLRDPVEDIPWIHGFADSGPAALHVTW